VREQEVAESGHQRLEANKDQQVIEYSSDEAPSQDDIESEDEDRVKVHNDEEIEKKLSKIQTQLLKSSVFGSKA
jgi:ribosomal protein L14